jgi:phage tail-like protein
MTLRNMLQNFILELDGQAAGRLFGMSGGGVYADVVQEAGGSSLVHKHITGVRYEEMTVTCGIGMSQAFYDWISNTLSGSPMRKNGAVVALNFNRIPVFRLEFRDALIKGIEFPALSAGSKQAAYMTISISPEVTRRVAKDLTNNPGVYVTNLPKGWHVSDFRLKIDGLENDCKYVTSISALKFGQRIAQAEGEKLPASVDLSDLALSLPMNKSLGLQQWFEDFVVKGSQNEKKGSIQFLTPNLNQAYFELDLVGLGPYSMEVAKVVNPDTALPTNFRMYFEGMKFRPGPSAVM